MALGKTVRNINRLGEVINILVKYSFEDIVANTPLRKFVSAKKQVSLGYGEKPFIQHTRFERIRMVIEEIGPTAIKLAQFLSNRPDILPEKLINEFTKLQSSVTPFSTQIFKEIIEKETNKKIDVLFQYLDNQPIGSASIGQVHRARLTTGEDVVVKVQRPDAEKKVITDLNLLREFVRLTENYFKNVGITNPKEIVDTFEQSMLKELDYTTEARSIQQFINLYSKISFLRIPKPFPALSTSKVLITEFTSGCKINETNLMAEWGLDPKLIAEKTLKIYLSQIFRFGLFHADPHPGNILVNPAGKISLIDFGMVGKLTKNQRINFAKMLYSLVRQDAKSMASSLRRLTIKSEIADLQNFENDLQELIDDIILLDVGQIGMKEIVIKLQNVLYKYKLHIPGSVFLILRALAILEGVIRTISPNIKIIDFIKPYSKRILKEQYNPKNIKADIFSSYDQLLSLMYNSPLELKYILQKVRSGDLKTNIEIIEYERFLRKSDTFVNKLVFSILISALIIGASLSLLIDTYDVVLTIFGLPIYSVIGYSLALLLAIWLLLYTVRQKFKN